MTSQRLINKSLSVIALQSRITVVVLTGFILGLLFMLKVSYNHAKSNLLENYKNNFLQRTTILDNSIGNVVAHINRMKSVSDETYRIHDDSIDVFSMHQTFLRRVSKNEKKGYYIWMLGNDYTGVDVYSTIAGKELEMSPHYLKTMMMSLRLQEVQRSYHSNSTNVVLSYYISEKQLLTQIYPPIPFDEIITDTVPFSTFISKAYEVYHEFLTVENNPDKRLFWTRPYIDRAGNGMMVTCAVPIVYNGEPLGVVGADVLLDFLNSHTQSTNELPGRFQLASQHGDIISQTDLVYTKEDELLKTSNSKSGDSSNHKYDWSVTKSGDYYLSKSLTNAPWEYRVELERGQVFLTTIDSIKAIILLVALILFIIPILFLYIKRKLIVPGIKAERELEQLNQELESTVQERTRQLRHREENLKITLNSIADAVLSTDMNGTVLGINPVAESLLGISSEAAIGKNADDIFCIFDAKTKTRLESPIRIVLESGRIYSIEKGTLLRAKDDLEYLIADSCAPIMSVDNVMVGTILVFRDVSDELRLEAELHHHSKMDAIGQLAGGISHDFNNMIGGILGAAELLKSSGEIVDDENVELVDIIIETSKRSSELTSKLLAFSRKGSIASTIIDLHKVLKNSVSILSRTIDKRITIVTHFDADTVSIIGDNSALQNSFMNIGINASHVMTEGGILEFTTENIELDNEYCEVSPFILYPGSYVKVSIRDTGTGIPEELLQKVFDPFFTTKKEGEGTGLGLAAVYGTVKTHKGEISVESTPGIGTTFHILLPCSEITLVDDKREAAIVKGKGNVLFIDDEKILRITGKKMLEELGYTVILAESATEGLHLFQDQHSSIDLVISDLIMPEMNGSTLFYKFKEINPDCPFIIASGFTKNESIAALKKDGLRGFLNKPFSISEISVLLARVLE